MLDGYKLLSRTLKLAQEIRAPQRLYQTAEIPRFTELKYLPRDAFYCGGKLMPLLDEQDKVNSSLDGRVCADQITPYPPVIPVLTPGQVITQAITQYLISMLRSQKHIEVHGVVYDSYLPYLRLLTTTEEKALKQLDK
jgi:arginine decarboxylase